MTKSFVNEERVIFPVGEQYKFLFRAKERLKISWTKFAREIGVAKRTFNEWKNEKYSLPFGILKEICKIAKLKIPNKIQIREPFWWTKMAGEKAGKMVYQKYGRIGGDPEYRKKKWYEWWEREGKFRKHPFIGVTKPIKKPHPSSDLAEFVGIMIGDGGITKKQVMVSLNRETEKYYSIFVKKLFKKLFSVEAKIYQKDKSTIGVTVSRVELVKFCKSIGLKIGNKLKQKLDLPEWIKKHKSFKISCIRGLIDTDGCLFNECHRINGKIYCYPRLCFTSYSKNLCLSVFQILKELGFSPKIRIRRNVQIENWDEIGKYFGLVGTHNLNLQKRYRLIFGGVGSGCPKRS